MPKSAKTIVTALVILIVVPYLLLQIYGVVSQMDNGGYVDFLNEAWELEMPQENYGVLYSSKSSDAFFGEGQRFHVIQFADSLSAQLAWRQAQLASTEIYFQTIEKQLDIARQYLPDFSLEMPAKTYFAANSTGSALKLIYFDELLLDGASRRHVLYVLEDLM